MNGGPTLEPAEAWGKLSPTGAWQPLSVHCRDVAAVFVALLRSDGFRRRLAGLAVVDHVSDVWIERLGWFVFLHDLGKVNTGFQARKDPKAPVVGHVKPIAGAFADVLDAIGAERTEGWADLGPLTDWFHAVLSHHGRPWTEAPDEVERRADPKFAVFWRPSGGYAPLDELRRLSRAADAMFPRAFDPAPPIPLNHRLVHALAGLVTLADWIASSDWQNSSEPEDLESWALGWLDRIGLDPKPWRDRLAPAAADFAAAFGFPPTPAQAAFGSAPGSVAILESETGSGKTEAALWRFVERFRAGGVDGLYFALPTRTAAVQLHARVERLLSRLWPDDPPPCVLAVPGYLDDGSTGALPAATDTNDAVEGDARGRPAWASEHPKSYFAGMIGVGTIDQALLATLRIKHAHLRGSALMRLMLVIDEVHASDAYMAALTEALLAAHVASGGEAALLSATLGVSARARYAAIGRTSNLADIMVPGFDEAVALPYPAISTNADGGKPAAVAAGGRQKSVHVAVGETIDDADAIAAAALEAAGQGAKVLVVRNTVGGAVAVQEAMERLAGAASPLLFRVEGIATLHHGRFAREDRRLLDHAVEASLGRRRPPGGLMVAGTQTLEQSLDIDADFLISDLCPVDVLLQRIGRLHRHVTEPDGTTPRLRPRSCREARVLVLTPPYPLVDLLRGNRRGRRSHGLGPVVANGRLGGTYPDLLALEATRRLCHDRSTWIIPAMNRDLVERALHPDAQQALLAAFSGVERTLLEQHRGDIAGTRFGDGTTARQAALRRDKPFMDPTNSVRDEESLASRLGEVGLLVDLPDGTVGPFGHPIRRLTIPARWHALQPAEVKVRRANDSNLQLSIGDLQLSYGIFGLHKLGG